MKLQQPIVLLVLLTCCQLVPRKTCAMQVERPLLIVPGYTKLKSNLMESLFGVCSSLVPQLLVRGKRLL